MEGNTQQQSAKENPFVRGPVITPLTHCLIKLIRIGSESNIGKYVGQTLRVYVI